MRWWGSEECEFDSRRVLVVEVLDAATAGAAVVRPLRAALPRLREHVSSAVARPPPHEAAHAERVVALLDVGHAFGRLAASELLAHCFGERETVVLGSLDHARVAEQGEEILLEVVAPHARVEGKVHGRQVLSLERGADVELLEQLRVLSTASRLSVVCTAQ